MSPELLRALAVVLECEADRIEERAAARVAAEHSFTRKPLGRAAFDALNQRPRDDYRADTSVDCCSKCGTKRIARPWRFFVDGEWQDTKPLCSR